MFDVVRDRSCRLDQPVGNPRFSFLRYRSVRQKEDGQAVVEFALVLPVLMLIVVGIFKFGIVFNNYLQLTDAVRAGARQLAIERGQGAPCLDAQGEVYAAAGSLDTTKLGVTMVDPPQAAYSVSGSNGVSATPCPTLASGDAATVSASYSCDLSFLQIVLPNCTISASSTERVE
jgi:Flp pilus assembly protein TadG